MDIAELSMSASSRLLGMDLTDVQVSVDGEHFDPPSHDVSVVRVAMQTMMYHNENLDFEIDALFEV